MDKHSEYMREAIIQAKLAEDIGEVPIGAVVVYDEEIVARAHNERIGSNDPTAHAEIIALRLAGHKLGRWNLSDCDMYVTLEPCAMCAGAIVNARLRTVYYGASDNKWGAMSSKYNIGMDGKLNHSVAVVGGILADECSTIISEFFASVRESKRCK